MRVGIDLRPLRRESSGGVVQLTESLCAALFRAAPEDAFVVYPSAAGYRLPAPLPQNVAEVVLSDDDPARLDAGLAHQRADVLFRPFPLDDALAFPPGRRFVLLPDLQHEDHPAFFSEEERARRSRAFAQAVGRGGAVGLLSEHARGRLRALFPDARARTVFVQPGPPGLDRALSQPLAEAEARAVPDEPFFLYPGHLWPHKNHRRLFRAFERFLAGRRGPCWLMLTGNPEGATGLLAEAPSLPIRHLGFVSPRLLAELYRRCVALTYVSLYEGFGLPLLEAFELGAPALCSDATSLVEVGGDAVVRCDPTDVAAMAEALARVADSPELRAELRARGRARLARYDWDRTATTLLGALRDLAGAPARHEDTLDAVAVLGDRLAALEDALRDRTAWAERMVRTAEARAQVIRTQEQRIQRLQRPPGVTNGRQATVVPPTAPATPATEPQPRADVEYDRLLAASADPLISVILPLPDHRGNALRSVRSWAREQTLPRQRYEVIVVGDGSEPELEARIEAVLGPDDRLIVGPPGNEVRLYDLGARQARGRWLFFSETHCLGAPDCLEETVRYLVASGADGACCRSEPLAENGLARMEGRLFEEVTPVRQAPGHWSKLFLRGSALARAAYLEVGGLAWRYGLFGEPELAARLHAGGYRLGFVPSAVVRHVNTRTVAELREAVHSYAAGECAYRLEHPDGADDAYFGTPDWWRRRALSGPDLDRQVWWSLGRSLGLPGADRPDRLRRWLRLAPTALLGSRWQLWRADWNVWQASVRCWWWRNRDDRLLPAYRELWAGLAEQGALRTLAAAPASTGAGPSPAGDVLAVGELPEAWLSGFHAVEALDGERFRWSGPLAGLKLPLEPRDQVLCLETRGLRPGVPVRAYLNGRPLAVRDCQAEHGEIRLALRRRHVRPAPFQYLVLLCEPLRPWLHGVSDRRELGLPLFRIRRGALDDGRRLDEPRAPAVSPPPPGAEHHPHAASVRRG